MIPTNCRLGFDFNQNPLIPGQINTQWNVFNYMLVSLFRCNCTKATRCLVTVVTCISLVNSTIKIGMTAPEIWSPEIWIMGDRRRQNLLAWCIMTPAYINGGNAAFPRTASWRHRYSMILRKMLIMHCYELTSIAIFHVIFHKIKCIFFAIKMLKSFLYLILWWQREAFDTHQ